MKRKIIDLIAVFFIACVGFMTFLSILSIWKLIDGDILSKSMATIGIIAFASLIAVFASNSMGSKDVPEIPEQSSFGILFQFLRYITSILLILIIIILTVIGVMAIWDVITDKDVLMKSISSMIVLATSSAIIIATCADREGKTLWGSAKIIGESNKTNLGAIIFLAISIFFVMLSIFRF